jgi:hypothetical protein
MKFCPVVPEIDLPWTSSCAMERKKGGEDE